MEFHYFLNLVGQKRKVLYGIVALFLVAAVVAIAVQRFKYSSESRVLVVQEYASSDAYAASKSSEYLSRTLASVVASNSFFTKVTAPTFNINMAYFGDTPKDQMKEWHRTVSAHSVNDSGAIVITVYHPDRAEAEKILRAVNYVLMTQHTAYHGFGESVKIRLIDQPVTSAFPVKPNIPLIAGLAFALGLVFALMYIYLSSDTQVYSFSYDNVVAQPSAAHRSRPQAHVQRPHHAGVAVHGQFPDEALANLGVLPTEENVMPQPSAYGHHATIAFQADNLPAQDEAFAEDVSTRGSMRNILN